MSKTASNHLEPAKSIITTLGGPDTVASITGKHVSRVYRWMYPRERGGTGGVIPHDEARKMLAHASTAGIKLSPNDFFAAASAGQAA